LNPIGRLSGYCGEAGSSHVVFSGSTIRQERQAGGRNEGPEVNVIVAGMR